MKHFKAVHRETKEEIFFDLINIVDRETIEVWIEGSIEYVYIGEGSDYEVFYQHQGEWFKYEH